jgi:hypothetical protein
MRHKQQPFLIIFALAVWFLLPAGPSRAAVNIGTANLGADPTSPDNDFITDSAPLTINSTKLTVIKKAFLDDNSGTEITTGSSVVKGTIVKFVMYIDNTTNSQASDVRIVDQLDKTGFTYQTGSLKWNNNTTATAATVATIFTDTNGGVALTDAISAADVGSVDGTPPTYEQIAFGAHSTQTNAGLNIPAGKVAAFMFRARVN